MRSRWTGAAVAEAFTLSESRNLRLFFLFILHVAQGVPIGLFWFAIPAWMAASGAGAGDIAFVLGLTALPWSPKLVNGFTLDRYTFLPMGRRRVWLIGAQLVMIALFIAWALLRPGVADVLLLGAIGFAVNTATTFQDVAVDGLAVETMDEDERGRASGMMFGGQSIGMALSTALSGLAPRTDRAPPTCSRRCSSGSSPCWSRSPVSGPAGYRGSTRKRFACSGVPPAS
jgi:MFS transporter, PAT family, beta-lactamase induction signal transducer AmpG